MTDRWRKVIKFVGNTGLSYEGVEPVEDDETAIERYQDDPTPRAQDPNPSRADATSPHPPSTRSIP